MTVAELYADDRNWCRHFLRKVCADRTQYCLEGALIHCYGDYTAAMCDAKQKVVEVLHKPYPYSIVAFNDARCRTPQQVRAIVVEAGV